MLMMSKPFSLLASFAIVAALTSGCALSLRNATVADLNRNPGHYQDKSVNIDGVVTSSWGVPLVPFKLYKVDDGTGEVTVVSQDGRAPAKGARVSVKGRVNEFGAFGGSSVTSFHRMPFRPVSEVHFRPGVKRIEVTWLPLISARPHSV